MAKMELKFDGFDDLLKRFAAAEADVKPAAEAALKETFGIVTEKAAVAVEKPNLPARPIPGRYSKGTTAKSLVREPVITWEGTKASVAVGFDIDRGGLPSIFMIKGTPSYMKNQLLYDAFYGEQTTGEIRARQKEIMFGALAEAEK